MGYPARAGATARVFERTDGKDLGEADWAERKAGRVTVGKGVLIVPFRIIHITPTFDEGMGPRQVSAGIKKERGTLMFKPKYRNLVIIGNGFDRWQGLPTAYDEFRKYYSAHLDETMNDLGIHSKTRPCLKNKYCTNEKEV